MTKYSENLGYIVPAYLTHVSSKRRRLQPLIQHVQRIANQIQIIQSQLLRINLRIGFAPFQQLDGVEHRDGPAVVHVVLLRRTRCDDLAGRGRGEAGGVADELLEEGELLLACCPCCAGRVLGERVVEGVGPGGGV